MGYNNYLADYIYFKTHPNCGIYGSWVGWITTGLRIYAVSLSKG